VADNFVGLDLGQATHYTTLTVLKQTGTWTSTNPVPSSVPTWCATGAFQLGTAYHTGLEYVAARFYWPPLEGTCLTLDQTVVGHPVVDTFRCSPLRAVVRAVVLTDRHTRYWEPTRH
jgi:hypothetical protein